MHNASLINDPNRTRYAIIDENILNDILEHYNYLIKNLDGMNIPNFEEWCKVQSQKGEKYIANLKSIDNKCYFSSTKRI